MSEEKKLAAEKLIKSPLGLPLLLGQLGCSVVLMLAVGFTVDYGVVQLLNLGPMGYVICCPTSALATGLLWYDGYKKIKEKARHE